MNRMSWRRAVFGATAVAMVAMTTGVLANARASTQAEASANTSANTSANASASASIPFANRGGIRDWEADKDRGLWVQDIHRNWYYAKFMGPCLGLNFANSIGFDTRPLGNFDRFSSVFVPGTGRCTVQSFTASEGPQAERDHTG